MAPFIPETDENFDQKNINEEWKDLDDPDFQEWQQSLRKNSVQAEFNGYYYDYQLAAFAEGHRNMLNEDKKENSEEVDEDDIMQLLHDFNH